MVSTERGRPLLVTRLEGWAAVFLASWLNDSFHTENRLMTGREPSSKRRTCKKSSALKKSFCPVIQPVVDYCYRFQLKNCAGRIRQLRTLSVCERWHGTAPTVILMAAESGRLLAGQGQGKRGKGSQMKSPEKKKRKSSTQGATFSHLSEFAPPPTPMVDHLVASNPFDDDFSSSSRPGGAGGPGSAPFLPSPGAGGGGGGYGAPGRMAGGMGFMGGPGGPGGGQPGRRPPFVPPPPNAGPHHPLGFGGMPGFGGGGGGGGGFPPGGPSQFNMPPNFSPPMHPGQGFNPMLSPGAMGGGPGGGGPPHPRFGMQQPQHGQGGHPFNSPPLPGGPGPRGPPHGPMNSMGGIPTGMNMMGGMGGGMGPGNMVGGHPGLPPQGQFPPSQDGPYPGPGTPGSEEGKNFVGGPGGGPPGPPQQPPNLNPSGPPSNNATPGPSPASGPPQPGGGFPGHPDVQQSTPNTPGQSSSAPPPPNPNSSPTGPLNGPQPQQLPPNQHPPPNSAGGPAPNTPSSQQQPTPPNSTPGSAPYNQQNSAPGGGSMPNQPSNSNQNNLNNSGGNTPGSNPNPPSNSTSTPNTQSPLPTGQAPPSAGPGSGPPKLGGGMVFPCGFCLSEVHDDQEAILCEASCQRWYHRDCTGLTEPAYGLLTRESAAVWACDMCLKTKEIQAVYVRQSLGQLVAANEG
ncbi:hypothetical protein MHYP_G00311310 [Metynnis hypsauchen]